MKSFLEQLVKIIDKEFDFLDGFERPCESCAFSSSIMPNLNITIHITKNNYYLIEWEYYSYPKFYSVGKNKEEAIQCFKDESKTINL